MTAVPPVQQCVLCPNEAVDTNHEGQLCEQHLAELEGVSSSDESSPSDPTDRIDNETETQEGAGAHTPRDPPSHDRSDDNPHNHTSYGTTLEAVRAGPLADLGAVFAPVQPGEKRCYASRDPEDLYAPDDEDLGIYLHSGFNYAVVTRGDLAVLDADDPEALADAINGLPTTAWQVSGSGEGEHYFLKVPGVDSNLKLFDPDTDEHLGEIIAAEQSYVVGPGSRHPSGNRYGPLEGEEIATLDEDEFRELIEPYRPDGADRSEPRTVERASRSGGGAGHDLDVYDVLSSGSYAEGSRCEHPFHGSDTGANFMVDDGGDTWRCWRHDCTGNALHLVGIEEGVISCGDWTYGGLPTDTWREIFTAAREAGYDLPDDRDSDDREPVAPIALARLEQLEGRQRERFLDALPDGTLAPTTDRARDRLRDALYRELRAGNTTVIDAPTALGKSHTAATTDWLYREDLTDDKPVIQLHATCDARDDAMKATRDSSATGAVLKGRKERCNVAAGDHDPDPDAPADEQPDPVVTIDGQPASEWLDTMCDQKGLPFSMAHAMAADRNDQELEGLPCCAATGECPAHTQWEDIPWEDISHRCEDAGQQGHRVEECSECRDGSRPAVDVVHATHQFAHVPSLRSYTNVIVDEQPDFTVDFTDAGTPAADTGRIRSMVTAYLTEIDAPTTTWEGLTTAARGERDDEDTSDELEELLTADAPTPDREWYVDHPDAHALAPDLTRAVWKALRDEKPDAAGQRATKVFHEPPRFDAEDYDGAWLSVVIDDENTVKTVRHTPDFSNARAVIGLDAHPSMPMWQLNVDAGMTRETILDTDERRRWRRYVRGLTVVQIGTGDDAATRPRSGEKAREWMHDERVRTLLETLRDHYGSDFRTAIAPIQVEYAVGQLLEDVAGGGEDAETMHYGEEKSRNDFADEAAGYLYGCMDPGDDMILDALTELGLDARPVTVETNDGDTVREKGRTFEGPDADTAAALLASVRENHVAQAAGRYARNPDDPDDHGTVYVDTNAMPPGVADLEVPGVEWLATDLQRETIDELVNRPAATIRELADDVDCTKEHVRQTLRRLAEKGLVERDPRAGDNGADVYRDEAATDAFVDLGETTNDPLQDNSRASLAIHDRHASSSGDTADGAAASEGATDGGTPIGGDRPPDDPA